MLVRVQDFRKFGFLQFCQAHRSVSRQNFFTRVSAAFESWRCALSTAEIIYKKFCRGWKLRAWQNHWFFVSKKNWKKWILFAAIFWSFLVFFLVELGMYNFKNTDGHFQLFSKISSQKRTLASGSLKKVIFLYSASIARKINFF